MHASVTLENITLSYRRHPAVHHLSGQFAPGSLTALTGPNGAGKSTLLKAIAGIIAPDEGHIHIENAQRRDIAYLPQASELQRDFPMSLLHLVCTGTWHDTGSFRAITHAMRTTGSQALERVGLAGFEKRDLASLSAGQFQRALFARLIVQDARLILLDEPFSAIDSDTTEKLLGIIADWHSEGRTIICVLHDFAQIRQHFPECLLLARECIAWGDTARTLSAEHLLGARIFTDGWNQGPDICERAS